ncbi:phasin family protein [Salmonella enterica subsp. enterica]|nr:phasin family protein [Salmonella enterica subsp. enterica serovar Enteritidis]
MAKKTDHEDSFMDIFSQFGKNLNMPNVDVEAILAHHRKNLEALQRAATAGASGAQSVMEKQREALQEGLQEIQEMAQSFRAPGGPQELLTKQAEFARKSFETAVKNTGEVADIMRRHGSESVDILRERIREAMDEVREAYEKSRK